MTKILVFLQRLEDVILYSLVAGLVGISTAQIWLRNVHDGGLYWGDSALRVMVFWLAMVGAMVASRETGHIAIDVVTHYLSPRWRHIVCVVTNLCAAAVCFVAAWHSYLFVLDEREFGDIAFASVPVWWCQVIMPLALAIIGSRLLVAIVRPINDNATKVTPPC